MIKGHAQYEIKKELFKNPSVSFWAKTPGSLSYDESVLNLYSLTTTEYQITTIDVGSAN
jgi:hypothetical protein